MRLQDLAVKTLNVLLIGTTTTIDIIDAVLSSPYGSSAGRLTKKFNELQDKRSNEAWRYEDKKKFYDLLYRLERDGLIQKSKGAEGRWALWNITARGKNKIETLSSNQALPKTEFPKTQSATWKIIIFDIPERQRRKRDWLRMALLKMGFKMIQKSVWIGKIKLPRGFIETIKTIDIVDFVEIFEITKGGSLKQLSD